MIDESIINESKNKLIYQLFNKCGDYELAQDMFQDACIKAYYHEKEFSVGGLYVMAKNLLLDNQRKKHVKLFKNNEDEFDIFNVLPADEDEYDYKGDAEHERRLRRFKRALNKIPKNQKEVVKLRLKGVMHKDMGMNVSKSLARYRRAMINLKAILI